MHLLNKITQAGVESKKIPHKNERFYLTRQDRLKGLNKQVTSYRFPTN